MSLLDEYDIEPDPRFEQIQQEAKVIFSYMIAMAIVVLGTAGWGSLSYNGSYEYILGLPTYILAIIIEIILFSIIGFIISIYYIEDTSLEAWGE